MIGLGLALARPERRVLVITGDGELLMGLGSLATIAVQRPANLALVVFDNERYGETGMQATHTAHGVDLAAIGAACGFTATGTLRVAGEVEAAVPALRAAPGPLLYVVKVRAEALALALPPRDGASSRTVSATPCSRPARPAPDGLPRLGGRVGQARQKPGPVRSRSAHGCSRRAEVRYLRP
jgi:thiamine pyrophosphate-dependent acetolactate synthase large subunit-like protein